MEAFKTIENYTAEELTAPCIVFDDVKRRIVSPAIPLKTFLGMAEKSRKKFKLIAANVPQEKVSELAKMPLNTPEDLAAVVKAATAQPEKAAKAAEKTPKKP